MMTFYEVVILECFYRRSTELRLDSR